MRQFKAEAAQLVLQSGGPIAKVAPDLQINEGTLGNWVTKWREENPEPEPALNPLERARLRELEDQSRKPKMENQFQREQRPSSPRRTQ